MAKMSVRCVICLTVLMTVGLSSAVVVVTGVCKSDSECMAAKGDDVVCKSDSECMAAKGDDAVCKSDSECMVAKGDDAVCKSDSECMAAKGDDAVCKSDSECMVAKGDDAVCKSDSECMDAKGDGSCCAAMSPDPLFRGVPKEPCHMASNVLPYPLPSPRIFWRCPCGPGLRCVAPRGGKVGRCKRESQAFSAGLDGEDLVV
uniref:Prokineticin domain-containing protein n=1 Tax=Branchiostoma floridae TaxID=7739 RepID=C3YWN4_BRAFL|eukprot:XP_002599266.1 hypothetical protein BRAFLDRAFT_64385 [Branchiostoma floridae]